MIRIGSRVDSMCACSCPVLPVAVCNFNNNLLAFVQELYGTVQYATYCTVQSATATTATGRPSIGDLSLTRSSSNHPCELQSYTMSAASATSRRVVRNLAHRKIDW